ncbi:hypothetical protein ACX84Z_24810, partial [Burkholderia pseudomallei]
MTVRDELAGDGAGRGRSRVRLRGRLRDGARMRRTPARQALQRWRPNAVRKFAAVRAGTASAAYAANAGVPSVEAVADEMPFASSQRLAHERHLPRMRRTPARQALQRWRPNAVRKFAAARARTASADGVCRSPLRSARRRSTRRCVAPRRIARFAAEPLSRRPRAEGGAP